MDLEIESRNVEMTPRWKTEIEARMDDLRARKLVAADFERFESAVAGMEEIIACWSVLMPPERVQKAVETRVIEIAPLAYMRGRTLADAFVILDEAQNATRAQMKMFLTRLGMGSKMVISGDTTQIDLPPNRTSGLVDAMRRLQHVISHCARHCGHGSDEDIAVVRSRRDHA